MRVTLLFIGIVLLIAHVSHATVHFKQSYTLFHSSTIYLLSNQSERFSTGALCRTIHSENPTLEKLRCLKDPSLQHDSSLHTYSEWLGKNLYPAESPTYLQSRDTAVASQFQSRRNSYYLSIYYTNDTTWALLFTEFSAAPVALLSYSSADDLYRALAEDLFATPPQNRRTQLQEASYNATPDDFYRTTEGLVHRISYGVGRLQGIGGASGGVVNFNEVASDTLSAWSWLHSPVLQHRLRYSIEYANFIGFGISYNYATIPVEYNDERPEYQSRTISQWSASRHEPGLFVFLTTRYDIDSRFSLYPRLQLGYHYTFHSPSLEATPPPEKPPFSIKRMRGASAGGALALMFNEQLGVSVEADFLSRGVAQDERIGSNGKKPAGGSTSEYTISLNLLLSTSTTLP